MDVLLTCVTWVTFSVTFWVRSLILLGAMISISVGEGGMSLSEPKDRVTWGMRPTARCLTRSESDVEFRTLVLRSAEGRGHIGVSVSKTLPECNSDLPKNHLNATILSNTSEPMTPDYSPTLTAASSVVTGSTVPFRPHSINIIQ